MDENDRITISQAESKKCNKCGKETTFDEGTNYSGLFVKLDTSSAMSKSEIIFLQNQMGNYQLKKQYCICYECFLDTFLKP